jgi:tRNA G18 (ribose-2'-O)-methylase SpoU
MELVEHLDDPRLDLFRRRDRQLANRPQRRAPEGGGWFLAEGDLVVERGLAAGFTPVAVLCDANNPPPITAAVAAHGGQVLGATESLRRQVMALAVTLPVIAVFERPVPRPADDVAASAQRMVALEAVDNPTNVGAIVRSTVALGWDALVVDHTSADPLARRSVRTSMGAVFAMPWARSLDLVDLVARRRAGGALTVALTPAPDAVDLDDVAMSLRNEPRPVVMVLGAERSGLSEAMSAICEVRTRIPMVGGVDSLNVAAAAAVAAYVLTRPR